MEMGFGLGCTCPEASVGNCGQVQLCGKPAKHTLLPGACFPYRSLFDRCIGPAGVGRPTNNRPRELEDLPTRRLEVDWLAAWPPDGLAETERPMNSRKLAMPLPVIWLALRPERMTVLVGAL